MSDDGSNCEERNELEWSESPDNIGVTAFTQRVGPTRAMPRNSFILDYFLLLFTTELLQLIVDNTNLYAMEIDLNRDEMLGDFARVRPCESRNGCQGCQVILCKGSCFEEWNTNLGASHRNEDTETNE